MSLKDGRLIFTELRPGNRGQWPFTVYRLAIPTAPHHGVRTGPHHGGRTVPHSGGHRSPPWGLTAPHHGVQTLIEPSLEEPLEPQAEPQALNSEEEPSPKPSPESVANQVRKRREEEQRQAAQEEKRLAELRKNRETIDELKKKYGPNFGLKSM